MWATFRKMRLLRIEEAEWWRYSTLHDEQSYFAVEGDKHIAFLKAQLAALEEQIG